MNKTLRRSLSITGLVALLLSDSGCLPERICSNTHKSNYHLTLYSPNGDTLENRDVYFDYLTTGNNDKRIKYKTEDGEQRITNLGYLLKKLEKK